MHSRCSTVLDPVSLGLIPLQEEPMGPRNVQQLTLRFRRLPVEDRVPPEPLARCQQLLSQLMIQVISEESRVAQETTDERQDSPEPS